MSLNQPVVLKTFALLPEAEAAATRLRASDVECLLQTDDAGGMYPSLQLAQGIRLLVDVTAVDRARDILSRLGEISTEELEELASAPAVEPKTAPAPSKLFLPGLIIGVVLGVIGCLTYHRINQAGRHEYRNDNDCWIYQDGHLVMGVADRNEDGKWDAWYYYAKDSLTRACYDDNFDGKIDAWMSYANGNPTTAWFDSDFNGQPDVTNYFRFGVLAKTDWQPNGTNVILLREFFTNGTLVEELCDLDGDGSFDVSVKYGPFRNPIATNFLNRSQPFKLLSPPPQ